jgi:ubiquinol-cytochrome c reductase cytochrome b subunit
MSPKLADSAVRQDHAIDSRYHPSAAVRRQLNKVFPTHWSFLLGEFALYSFIVLLITGVYLTLFFDPSMAEVTYNGVYQPLRGVEMSPAYASALDISFEVRSGLLVRQIHHWAALMFAAAIMVHLARIFFTGAFRRPREANWVIGSLLLILTMFEGLFGYSLPDDLLSGIGVRATLSSITLGLPVIGTWLHWALFGGDFPGDAIIPRLYALHILIFPAIILALIGIHLAMVWFQKHPVSGPRSHREECCWRADHAGVRGEIGRVLRDHHRHPRPDGRAAADQPDLATRPLSAVAGRRRYGA